MTSRSATDSTSGGLTTKGTDTINGGSDRHAVNEIAYNLRAPRRRIDALVTPSRSSAIKIGLIALALIVATTIVEIALHGLHVESWGSITSSALVLVPTWGGLLMLARYRLDRRLEWLFIGLGSLGWAAGQLLWIIQITLIGSQAWPSAADIGYLMWPIGVIAAVMVHIRPFERSTRIVFIVDSMVMAVALSFIAWELIIRSGVGDPARFSLPAQLAMLIYPLTDIAVATMLGLMLLIGRTPARVCLLIGAIFVTVADIAYSATVGSTSNVSYAVSFPAWALGFGFIAVTAGLPSGGIVRYTRPTMSRLLLVHVPAMAAVWLAAWRYMVRDVDATTVTIVIGVFAGLLIIFEQMATWYHSSTLSDRLQVNITNLRHTEAELRALLDDLPDSVIVLDGAGRIVEANKLALEITGRSHALGAEPDVRFAGPSRRSADADRGMEQTSPRAGSQQPGLPVRPSERPRDPSRSRRAHSGARSRACGRDIARHHRPAARSP